MSHPISKFVAGKYRTETGYKRFLPALINLEWLPDNPKLLTLLSEADRSIGELNMYSHKIPNIDIFISMHRALEASQSSRIEGTRTNIEETFLDEIDIEKEKQIDWKEVQNYITAMNTSLEELKTLPLSNRLIRRIHKILLESVRGEKKTPGEFRTSQNWIDGAAITDATFVPPNHFEISELMSDMEKFIHNDKIHVPHLIKIGIIHYQFETIHPFLDGNGRIGRLLITLYLVDSGLLKKPILYLSDFFERNKSKYYDNLMLVRDKNNLEQWLIFFLTGIIETSNKSIETFDNILNLKQEVESKIIQNGKQVEKLTQIMEYLYSRPIVTAKTVQHITGAATPTVYSLIKILTDLGVLKEMTGRKRNRYFQYMEYLNLFRHKS